jgi:hypothetical protein
MSPFSAEQSGKEGWMRAMVRAYVQACLVLGTIGLVVGTAFAEPYELSKNDVMDPKAIKSPDISLFGVKIGDSHGCIDKRENPRHQG